MKLRKVLSLILAAVIMTSSLALSSNAVVTSSDFTADELDSSSYDIRKYTDPFWEGNIVYNEIVHPIRNKDGSLPSFELMYDATEIVSVKDYTLNVTYKEGVDYMLMNGNLYIMPSGNISIMNYENMHPSTVPSNYGKDEFFPYYPHADKVGYEYWTGGNDVCKKSIAVTYIHNDTWDAPIQTSEEANLPNTFEKLKNDEPLTIVVAGDSVASGAMSSGFLGMSPYADAYPEMAEKALKEKYSNDGIKLINSAIGGTISNFDETKMNNTIIQYSPDLVILNFGMNDSSYNRVGIPKAEFKANNALQIEYIQKKLPECEILLLSSLYGNRYTFPAERYEEHAAALHALAAEYEGVGVADPQRIEKYLIEETGKDYICFTADNMVHPGDLGMRLSAQTIIEALSMSDIAEYRSILIEQMTDYADLQSKEEGKVSEILAVIDETSAAIADLDEEWDINKVVDEAYEEIDKIILRCDTHAYVDNIVAPTCKNAGYTNSVCSVCGNVYTHSYTDPIGGEHIMNSGMQTISPTYKASGAITYSCVKCSYTETEAVPMLTNPPTMTNKGMLHFDNDHNYMESSLQPYTGGSGYVELDFCPLDIERYNGIPYIGLWFCGYTVTACYNFRTQQVQIIETSLPFATGTVYASADYKWTSDGSDSEYNWKKFAVHLNGTTVRIYIDGKLILEDTKSFYRASSEIALLYSNGECYIDNIKIVKGNYDPTTGTGGTLLGSWNFDSTSSYNSFHNGWTQHYGNMTYVNANAANVTTGHYSTHTHSGTVFNIVSPGCAHSGYAEYVCDICGAIYRKNFTDSLYDGHTLINQTIQKQPTTLVDGLYTYECETCDMTFTEVIPKGTVLDGEVTVFPGDANGDMLIDNNDLAYYKGYISGGDFQIDIEHGDITGDGTIDNQDLAIISLVLSGGET